MRLLGTILGNVLVEQVGEWLLEAVERVRLRSRDARSGGGVADVELSPEQQASLRDLMGRGRGHWGHGGGFGGPGHFGPPPGAPGAPPAPGGNAPPPARN